MKRGAFFATLLGCCGPFIGTQLAPEDQLTDARALALGAEPTALAPSGSVHLDALTYLPPGAAAPTFAWSWCPVVTSVGTDLTCSVSEADFQSALDPDGTLGISVSFSLGTEATAAFAYPAPVDRLRALCPRGPSGATGATDTTGISGDSGSTGASGGTGVRLACTNEAATIAVVFAVGGSSVRAFRTLSLRFTPDTAQNLNPTIDAIALSAPDGSDPGDSVVPGTVYTLGAAAPTGASETIAGFGPMANGAQQLEGLSFAWYVSAGALAAPTTVLDPGATPDSRDWGAALHNTWTAPTSAAHPIELVVVVRDTRGGVGWTSRTVTLGGK
jgi:hypothetical protein